MTWTTFDGIYLIGWTIFVFWEIDTTSKEDKIEIWKYYQKVVGFKIPGWLFGVIWFFIYCLMIASGFLFFNRQTQQVLEINNTNYTISVIDTDDSTTLPTFIIYFINIILNKYWSVVFFEYSTQISLFIAVLILGTSWTTLGLMLSESNRTASEEVAAWLLIPYGIWSFVALVLNTIIVLQETGQIKLKKTTTTDSKLKPKNTKKQMKIKKINVNYTSLPNL